MSTGVSVSLTVGTTSIIIPSTAIVQVSAAQINVPLDATSLSAGVGVLRVTDPTGVIATYCLPVDRVRKNWALKTSGASASASSTYSGNYSPDAVINGNRTGRGWNTATYLTNGGWNDANTTYPDYLTITFAGIRYIDEIDVYTLQDNYPTATTDPSATLTFTKYGIINFNVQYWDGSVWVTVPGGAITNNNLVWRQIKLATPVTTDKIRIEITAAKTNSRLVEVEAWGYDTVIDYTTVPTGVSISPTTLTLNTTTTVTVSAISGLLHAVVGYSAGDIQIESQTDTSLLATVTGYTVTPTDGVFYIYTMGGNASVLLPTIPSAPTITSVTPNSVPQGILTPAVISGLNLLGALVTADNATITVDYTTSTATTLYCSVLGTSVSTGTLTVTNNGSTATTSFSVTEATLAVTSFTGCALVGAESSVTIYGANIGLTSVTLASPYITSYTVTPAVDHASAVLAVLFSNDTPLSGIDLQIIQGATTNTITVPSYVYSITEKAEVLASVGAQQGLGNHTIYAVVRHPGTGRYFNPATLLWESTPIDAVKQYLIEENFSVYSNYISIPSTGQWVTEYIGPTGVLTRETMQVGGSMTISPTDISNISDGVWGAVTRTLTTFGTLAQDIDTQLSSTHGSGLWGGGGGSGSIAVNHNTGGTDNLRYVTSGGVGVDNANITAYLASDFYAGNIIQEYVKGNSTTNVEGRWVSPIMLDANDYVITFCKQGDFNTTWKIVTVS